MPKKKSMVIRVDGESYSRVTALLKARKLKEPRSALADVIRDLLNNYETETKGNK